MELSSMRVEYGGEGLSESDLPADPLKLFGSWLKQAVDGDVSEPNAMVLSTVDASGSPFSRHVLLKSYSASGFVFFTNYGSIKSRHLMQNPAVSLTFGWLSLHRQVHIRGSASKTTGIVSDQYWAERSRLSQLGSAASSQSEELASREELLIRFHEVEKQYPEGTPVKRPEVWGGWQIDPVSFEFWQGRSNRMHDRFVYMREGSKKHWGLNRLSP